MRSRIARNYRETQWIQTNEKRTLGDLQGFSYQHSTYPLMVAHNPRPCNFNSTLSHPLVASTATTYVRDGQTYIQANSHINEWFKLKAKKVKMAYFLLHAF